jgi:Collagen triple helix repeat (20 copies)
MSKRSDATITSRIRQRLGFANVVSVLALFLALTGGAYAALKLPSNSVGTPQLKNRAVTLKKISPAAQYALRGAKGSKGDRGLRGDKGDKGDRGDKGDTGAPGTAAAFARVAADGSLEPADAGNENKNVMPAEIQHASVGVYCFGGLPFTPVSIAATVDDAGTSPAHFTIGAVVNRNITLNGCDANHQQARVTTVNLGDGAYGPAAADHRFFVWFESGTAPTAPVMPGSD